MGQTTKQIETHIERTRDDLGSNIHELERKIHSVTDWKQHFQNSPLTMIGAAFGGGVVLAAMLGNSHRSHRSISLHPEPSSSRPSGRTDHQTHRAYEAWDNIKGALLGVAATRFTDYVGELVPGFDEQLEKLQGHQDKPIKSDVSGAVGRKSTTGMDDEYGIPHK